MNTLDYNNPKIYPRKKKPIPMWFKVLVLIVIVALAGLMAFYLWIFLLMHTPGPV